MPGLTILFDDLAEVDVEVVDEDVELDVLVCVVTTLTPELLDLAVVAILEIVRILVAVTGGCWSLLLLLEAREDIDEILLR